MGMKAKYPTLKSAINDLDSIVSSDSTKTKANITVSNEFVKLATPRVAKGETGNLRKSIPNTSEYDKGIIRMSTPYATYINGGISQSGKPLNYTEPTATDHPFEKTRDENTDQLVEAYSKVIDDAIKN